MVGAATATSAASLLEAVAAAVGEIGDAGGSPDTLALSFAQAATQDTATATDGTLLYPQGFAAAVGLAPVRVPGLATPLVYDSSRVYLVERDDFSVEQSEHAAWRTDGRSLRVKGRFAVALPTPAKAIRSLTVTA